LHRALFDPPLALSEKAIPLPPYCFVTPLS
jgi:hypothetical protein